MWLQRAELALGRINVLESEIMIVNGCAVRLKISKKASMSRISSALKRASTTHQPSQWNCSICAREIGVDAPEVVLAACFALS